MSKTLEEIIDAELVNQRLLGLTIYRTTNGRWQANITKDRVAWDFHISETPSEALRVLLSRHGMADAPEKITLEEAEELEDMLG